MRVPLTRSVSTCDSSVQAALASGTLAVPLVSTVVPAGSGIASEGEEEGEGERGPTRSGSSERPRYEGKRAVSPRSARNAGSATSILSSPLERPPLAARRYKSD